MTDPRPHQKSFQEDVAQAARDAERAALEADLQKELAVETIKRQEAASTSELVETVSQLLGEISKLTARLEPAARQLAMATAIPDESPANEPPEATNQ